MALSGNGRTLYEIRGCNDTRLRLTLATDPATAKLRVDWRWWIPSRVPGRTHDTTPKGAAIPAGRSQQPRPPLERLPCSPALEGICST